MIINKTYEFNYAAIDSVILDLAKDIENGFTVNKIERAPLELCPYARNLKPSYIITLRNKKVDELR